MEDLFASLPPERRKAFRELEYSFAGVSLHLRLLEDLDRVSPDYVSDLRERINRAIETADDRHDPAVWEGLTDQQRAYPEGVPFRDLKGREDEDEVFDAYELADLRDELQPLGSHAGIDLRWLICAWQVVAIHSALERFLHGMKVPVITGLRLHTIAG